jgi:hypothetical protein
MKRTILCLLAVAAAASATTISGTLTVDNQFNLYLSTSPNVVGTLLASGTNWQAAESFTSSALTPYTTYYLQIDATNLMDGNCVERVCSVYQWGGVLGSFSLNGPLFQFANGGQSLNTNTTDWTYTNTGFSALGSAPGGYGTNGVSPWGTIAGVDSGAQWVWDANSYNYGPELFFETKLTALTPEPASLILMGAGLVALGLLGRKRLS